MSTHPRRHDRRARALKLAQARVTLWATDSVAARHMLKGNGYRLVTETALPTVIAREHAVALAEVANLITKGV